MGPMKYGVWVRVYSKTRPPCYCRLPDLSHDRVGTVTRVQAQVWSQVRVRIAARLQEPIFEEVNR